MTHDIFSDDDPLPAPVQAAKPELAQTFEAALAQLGVRQQAFVRFVVAGKSYIEAYIASSDTTITRDTARVNGQKMAHQKLVKHAIALGKKAGAVQTIAGVTYDLRAAEA